MELNNATKEWFCREQIEIPPSLPFILKQYMKAAIKSQPADLLRWSAAYFRSLATNKPIAVKSRLEYPVTFDYHGLTPGWVKSLYRQIVPGPTIDFEFLWSRWSGSCLEDMQLAEILSFGHFKNRMAIPLLQFIGLCAAMVSKNLSLTMILVCEILTDEPEGGSAAITVDQLLTIYRFLARLDGSKGVWIKNKFFPELWKIKKGPVIIEKGVQIADVSEVQKSITTESGDITLTISCPSVEAEDCLEELEEFIKYKEEERKQQQLEEKERRKGKKSPYATDTETSATGSPKEKGKKDKECKECDHEKGAKSEKGPKEPDFDEKGILEDLAKLKALQEEMRGEDDTELQKYKEQLMKQFERTASEIETLSHFASTLHGQEEKVLKIIGESEETIEEIESEEEEEEDIDKYFEEIYVPPIIGLGPTVPCIIIKEVEDYMKEKAKEQHGLIMPRNIRHYTCPPLDESNDFEKEIISLEVK